MSFVFGPRFGKNFKLKKPEQTIAIWAGGFRVHLSSQTEGSINLSEVINTDDKIQTTAFPLLFIYFVWPLILWLEFFLIQV